MVPNWGNTIIPYYQPKNRSKSSNGNKGVKGRFALKKPRIAASWEDGQRLLAIAESRRDILLLRLCLYQGLREGEILGNEYSVRKDGGQLKPLTVGDLDLANKTIHIGGKGGTQEIVNIDTTTHELLARWVVKHRLSNPSKKIFEIGSRQFRYIVKDLAKKADLENWKRFSPHVLRAIAITYYSSKKGISRAMYFARHKSINTTAIYDRPDRETRRDDDRDVFG